MDEKDFAADSWSLAVDSSFLQQHKKEVMKQQDVIYGEPRPPRDSSTFARSCPLVSFCQSPPLKVPPSDPIGLQDPAWHPTDCHEGLLVSKALSLSLHSSQFFVRTLGLFHARYHARDCGKPRHVDKYMVLALKQLTTSDDNHKDKKKTIRK